MIVIVIAVDKMCLDHSLMRVLWSIASTEVILSGVTSHAVVFSTIKLFSITLHSYYPGRTTCLRRELRPGAHDQGGRDAVGHIVDFIGPLQSNKAAPLVKKVGLPKLACVETVASMKLANKLNNADGLEDYEGSEDDKKLGIYLQVNTSGEESKSGLAPGSELVDLAKDIAANCPRLSINGLMTIGAPGDLSCFDALVKCREEVAEALGVETDSLDLSMGMSGDYDHAIERGATSVRVGSTIFGARDYSILNKN